MSKIKDLLKQRLRKVRPIVIIWRWVDRWGTRVRSRYYRLFPRRIFDANLLEDGQDQPQKNALLSYIVHPFFISCDDTGYYRHINLWRASEMVRILNRMGYRVDIIDCTDDRFVPKKRYDLFIGHRGVNFSSIASALPEETTRIYFTTSNYWQYRNRVIKSRYDALAKRKSVTLNPKRLLTPKREAALRAAHGVIGIGGRFSKQTYAGFDPIIMLNNTALPDSGIDLYEKDFRTARHHFLFFAGDDNVLKGLDLLLEAFVDTGEHLSICSFLDQEIAEIYSRELNENDHIHYIGKITPRSDLFYQLMAGCGFVVLPSCSEGQPHSVVECMNQGLIPVVSEVCSLDVDGFGKILRECSVAEIRHIVSECAQWPVEKCLEASQQARTVIQTNFSEEAFRRGFSDGVMEIVKQAMTPGRQKGGSSDVHSVFVDENHTVSYARYAEEKIRKKNDHEFQEKGKGIVAVDKARWEAAQRFERRSWMGPGGLKRCDDRNIDHRKSFNDYRVLKGRHFARVIELGCGPFTNLRHIIKKISCGEIVLLDPLIDEYLDHPHCTYKNRRFGGWPGRVVETVASPIEAFVPKERFDLVVMINVLEHCYSVSVIFEKILSMMSPEGVFIFNDKLIPEDRIDTLLEKLYDTGHPLRFAQEVILDFLDRQFEKIYQHEASINTAYGKQKAIYYIGKRINTNGLT